MRSIPRSFFHLSLLGLLLTGTSSCDLLQQDSPSAFSPDEAFSSPGRIAQSATGMYDALQNRDFLGSRALVYNDVRSDDVDPPGRFSSLATGNITTSDAFAADAWTGGYQSMYMANYFMREVDKRGGGGLTPEAYSQYMGEAKFIRALCHFTLVNMYAQPYKFKPNGAHPGIPLQLTALDGTEAYDPNLLTPRATVAEVYNQVEQDLLAALQQLPESNPQGDIMRANKDAARGLLSRVYLYKGEYDKARQYAEQVINGGRHQLNTTAYAEFRTMVPLTDGKYFTSEAIFAIAMSQSDNPNTNHAIGNHYAPGTGDISVSWFRNQLPGPAPTPTNPNPTNTAANTDLRRLQLLERRGQFFWTRKYASLLEGSTAVSTSNVAAWIPIVRYPEMLLTYAEAKAEQANGIDADALAALNQVRNRSKPTSAPVYTVASFSSKQDFIEAILRERRYELAFEGHRLFDLFRRGRNVPAHGGNDLNNPQVPELPYGSTRAVLPIPPNEIARNPKLEQNDGY
ncbi:RagB/SusD family nutrient uptake outer membrane protein [Hymenobacter coalescens]